MKICVTAGAFGLDAPFDTRFGRCPFFTVVETDEMTVESIPNSIAGPSRGAGMYAAQVVAGLGVAALITGKIGPNALQTLSAVGIGVYRQLEGTVGEAAELFKQGGLQKITSPSAQLSPGICRGQMGQEPQGRRRCRRSGLGGPGIGLTRYPAEASGSGRSGRCRW